MILLTDEEILKLGGNLEWTPAEGYVQIGAKAQLKRVMEWLKDCDGELVSKDNKPFTATFEMPVEEWQALLKEVNE